MAVVRDEIEAADVTTAELYTLNLDALADRHTIAGLLSRSDPALTAERIRQWAKRGRIQRRGTDPQGRTLYRIGDILTARHARYQRLPAHSE